MWLAVCSYRRNDCHLRAGRGDLQVHSWSSQAHGTWCVSKIVDVTQIEVSLVEGLQSVLFSSFSAIFFLIIFIAVCSLRPQVLRIVWIENRESGCVIEWWVMDTHAVSRSWSSPIWVAEVGIPLRLLIMTAAHIDFWGPLALEVLRTKDGYLVSLISCKGRKNARVRWY